MKTKQLNLLERAAAPTPKFFKRLRNIGLILAAASGAIFASPVALPALVIQVAGYLTVAGSVLTAVSQTTVDEDGLGAKVLKRYEGVKGENGKKGRGD